MNETNNDSGGSAPKPTDVTNKVKNSIFAKFKVKIDSMRQTFKNMPPKKRIGIIVGVSVGILIAGILILKFSGPKALEPDPVPVITKKEKPPEPTTVPSRLTGVQVEPELDKRAVTGVMIENSVDARPQAGLNEAGVVFEAIAEGGITRFLALFQESSPGNIGPIRSARPYYVRWAAGFDAAYVHSGGSGEALALIAALGIKDMDHGRNSGYFDRVSNRYAPHNVFTSMDRLDQMRKDLGYTESKFTGFERLEAKPKEEKKPQVVVDGTNETTATPQAEVVNKISFNISSPLYNTSYTYNPTTNKYARVMAGIPHTDEKSGAQITPSVVIAMYTPFGYNPNGVHSTYSNVGSGNVLVFQNGTVIAGKWTKASDTAELKFTTVDDKPLKLQPGQTWITAIPEGRVTYSP